MHELWRLVERSNRYARWALGQHLGKGDAVCLLIPNRPEYMAAWLGITRIGDVMALLSTNLVGAPLAYCIDIADPKHIIVAHELTEALRSAQIHLTTRTLVCGERQHADIGLWIADHGLRQNLLSGRDVDQTRSTWLGNNRCQRLPLHVRIDQQHALIGGGYRREIEADGRDLAAHLGGDQ
jgi:acyl-CoA synthetase (AMP-forming)/AMP-acid ligase II